MTRQRLRLVSIVAVGALILAALLVILAASRSMTVAVHGLGEREQAAFRKALAAYPAQGARPRLRAPGGRSALASLVSGPFAADLVVFRPGAESSALAAAFAPIPDERRGLVSKSLLAVLDAHGAGGAKPYALPLLLDDLELSWSMPAFVAAGLAPPLGAAAFEAAAAALAAGPGHPLLVAGGDDLTLVALVGFLLADRHGVPAYEALAAFLGEKGDPAAALDAPLPSREGGSASLRSTLDELSRWERARWLPPEWLRFDRATCARLVAAGQASISIEFLSQRRLVPYEAISTWAYGRLALRDRRAEAPLAATLAAAAIPARSRRGAEAARLREHLLSGPAQDLLSRELGAAPAALAVAAPDALASDARSWAVLSGRVLLGLAGESGVGLGALAEAFRRHLVASR